MSLGITWDAAAQFIATEMRLLDEWRLEEWLALFTADGIYWLARQPGAEPRRENAIIFDDGEQRDIRVRHLLLDHPAQEPRSHTVHISANLELEEAASETPILRCTGVVFEMRPTAFHGLDIGRGEVRPLPGHFLYRLRRTDGSWRISEKQVLLISRSEPLYNLSFII